MRNLLKGIVLILLVLCAPVSYAATIFDNGPVDPTRGTWNMTDPQWTIYDDFVLNSPTEITGINHSIFKQTEDPYVQNFVSIWDGIGTTANQIIPE